jgi:putative tricarboxylic transport membrane protein
MQFLVDILTLTNVFFSFLGVLVGITFGIIPGLTATMGVALFLPFTFGMDSIASFAFLLGIYCGGIYGGSITAILIRTPGTPAAAATVLDGYPLTTQGKAMEGLSLATIASFLGGIFSCIMLILVAPILARFALKFGPTEYFAVGFFGLSVVSRLSSKNLLKGFLGACLGLLIATIGTDPLTGTFRFTFGLGSLMGGVSFVSALIGLFAIAEVILKIETICKNEVKKRIDCIGGKFISFEVLKDNTINFFRSSIIGTIIGIIPAVGSGTASWFSYNEAQRFSRCKEKFGKGSYEGLAASETANNAVTGGALIPLLTLGIPGDIVTAIMLGALMIQGLTPGPRLFAEHADIVHGIYLMLILANFFMLIIGLMGTKLFVKILKIPTCILMPVVLCLCFIGSYAINNSLIDMRMAFLMGILGYIFEKTDFPVPPVLLGMVLSPIIELNFRRSWAISHGDLSVFLTRPISGFFIIISFLSFLWPVVSKYLGQSRILNKR